MPCGERATTTRRTSGTAACIRTYRPYYPTYGFGASYNPWTGAYTRGAVAYGPYGGAGVAQRYNPRTGTYSRGAAAWGPYGARGAASAYNPRTGAYGATRQGSNVYGSWGTTGVARGDDWARTSRYTNNITGNTTRVTQGSDGGAAITRNAPGVGGRSGVARTEGGDVYAGRDGNVYRKDGDSWQKVRQRRLERRGSADTTAAAAGAGPRDAGRRTGGRSRSDIRLGLIDPRPGDPRFRRTRRGCAAHPRLRQRPERHRVEIRQLSSERRKPRGWRASSLTSRSSGLKTGLYQQKTCTSWW